MRHEMAHTAELRNEMVRRMTGPSRVTARALHRETGISQESLSRWLVDARKLSGMTQSKLRTPEEKLRLVIASSALEGAALSAFMRAEGVLEVELRDWRATMLENLSGGKPPKTSSEANELRQLKKELSRKDKALAEFAALLVLKKKAIAAGLLEPEDDGTTEKSEG